MLLIPMLHDAGCCPMLHEEFRWNGHCSDDHDFLR